MIKSWLQSIWTNWNRWFSSMKKFRVFNFTLFIIFIYTSKLTFCQDKSNQKAVAIIVQWQLSNHFNINYYFMLLMKWFQCHMQMKNLCKTWKSGLWQVLWMQFSNPLVGSFLVMSEKFVEQTNWNNLNMLHGSHCEL